MGHRPTRRAHDGAQFNLFDPAGWRHQVFITNSTDTNITYLEARHRGHARIEDRIRCAKDTGLRNLPFGDFANNACWVELICLAQDLIVFTQGLVFEGELAKAEPKRLRYTLLHTAGRLSTSSRRTILALQREMAVGRCVGRGVYPTPESAAHHLKRDRCPRRASTDQTIPHAPDATARVIFDTNYLFVWRLGWINGATRDLSNLRPPSSQLESQSDR